MTVLALVILALVFHFSVCNENQGLGISTSNKAQIACAQLRASNCSQSIGWDLRCAQVGLTVTAKPKAMRPGYQSFKAGKAKINVKKHVTPLSWDAALGVCQSEGGSLVKIDTEEKGTAIKEKMKFNRRFGRPTFLWIGLRYFKNTSMFLWTDKTPLEHENWGYGQPIITFRTLGYTIKTECVTLANYYRMGAIWVARQCVKTKNFICEVN